MEHGAATLKSVALHFHQQVQQEGDESQVNIKDWNDLVICWKGRQMPLACMP